MASGGYDAAGPELSAAEELAQLLADEGIADTALNDDLLEDAWEKWASHWESEFTRLDGLGEQWREQAAQRVKLDARAEVEFGLLGEAAARAKVLEEQVEEMRREEAREKVRQDAAQARKAAAVDAFADGDDMVRQIAENAAKRRAANEERRRKENEAAREAQRKKYAEPSKPQPKDFSGFSAGAAAPPGGAARPPPPRARASSLPTEGQAPPVRAPPPRFSSFGDFDAHWLRFEQTVKAGAKDLHLIDIPWPSSLTTVSGVTTSDKPDVKKRKLRAALVRWHPDKWGKLMECVHESDREKVVERVKEVTRRIIEEKKRYS